MDGEVHGPEPDVVAEPEPEPTPTVRPVFSKPPDEPGPREVPTEVDALGRPAEWVEATDPAAAQGWDVRLWHRT